MSRTRVQRSLLGAALMVTALVGCSKSSKRLGDQPELVAAVKAYLAAESMGFASGNPALAASLASGDAATENQVAAAALQSQMEHGDPTNYAYSVVAVTAFPLDGGATNFISEDTTRDDSDGGIGRYLDLFQRPGPSGTWRVFAGVGLNANIDAPTLRLTAGGAHLLTAAEAQAVGADPQAIASRYVSAMNAGVDTGQLESGTFAPSASTTGVVDSELTFKEIYDLDGSGTLTWTARPGGDDVQLANGVLVFCSAQEVKTINRATYGNTNYFVTQDAQERSFGGLLAPGNYASITETMLVSLAVVVPRSGLPDVVGMDESTTSVTDTLAR